MRLILAASALTLAAMPGLAGPNRSDVQLATPAGEPVSCISTQLIRETRVRDDSTIDFVMAGGKVYRNTLEPGRCPQLGFEKRFLYETHGSQLCSVDIITVLVEPGLSRGASCGLGKFQPVTLSK